MHIRKTEFPGPQDLLQCARGVHVMCTWCARGVHVVCSGFSAPCSEPAASEELTLVSKTWLPSGNYEGPRGHRECGTSAMRVSNSVLGTVKPDRDLVTAFGLQANLNNSKHFEDHWLSRPLKPKALGPQSSQGSLMCGESFLLSAWGPGRSGVSSCQPSCGMRHMGRIW
jgi:hypothetical protein